MSLPRPRSDRLGSADETLHQVAAGSLDIWTPMSTVANGVTLTTQPPYFNGPASVASSSLRSESPMSPIQKLDHYQLESNPRYSTIGRPGRGLHHHLHTNSPGRSVMIVAPGDPIPPHLPPQQQLQLQQMSSDFQPNPTRPPSSDCYGWHRPILKRSCSLCDCHQIVREKRQLLKSTSKNGNFPITYFVRLWRIPNIYVYSHVGG